MILKKYVFNIYVSSFNDKVLLVKKREEKNVKKIFSLFVCAMMCLISTNLVFADGTVDIHGTYSIHVGGYDWGSATDNKKAENNPSQAVKTGDTAHGEIYAMIMMLAAARYVFFKQRKGAKFIDSLNCLCNLVSFFI